MFGENLSARASQSAGTLYAVAGPCGSIFYGQMCADGSIAFFKCRESQLSAFKPVNSTPVMSRISVSSPSLGRAVRSGIWKVIGKAGLRDELLEPSIFVQWPVGTLNVNVWHGSSVVLETRIEDPRIQELEISAVWDACDHVPLRLLVDYSPNEAKHISSMAWTVAGPVWRSRCVREEYARRFPDSHHALPADWVPVDRVD